jgi:hypothetical protein
VSNNTDPIILSAQARAVAQTLHKRDDIVVKFKTNESGYSEDALSAEDEANPGHFRADSNLLTINLDAVTKGKAVRKLDSIEDFREHPVLAGVMAHEAGRARWSDWTNRGTLPESIPNPDFDPAEPTRPVMNDEGDIVMNEDGTVKTEPVPESFPVSGNGKLIEMAEFLEEPRVERIASNTFTKTWKKAMTLSAGHLVLEQVEKMDEEETNALDSAVRLLCLVGGRSTAGTLGSTYEGRKAVKKVMESAEKILTESLPDVEDPFHKIMGIINKEVFNNDHEDAVSHLEHARQILSIIHPEQQDDPDAPGPGEGDGEGEEGTGMPGGAGSAEGGEAMKAMQDAMREAIDGLNDKMNEMIESPNAMKDEEQTSGGYGAVMYQNPEAPKIARHEQPTAADRELYKRARSWMQQQIEPTVSATEFGQWLPGGGARLNVRSHIRDGLAGHRGAQRSDWDRVSETIKTAPPVKVAIMLDGSGSMSSMARPSAAIAWAAANAAADLPESRTVSVVYGNAAAVTQVPGHAPARTVAVSNTDGGMEDFIGAAALVEQALWLDEDYSDEEKSNVLIIVVSDLMYGGRSTKGFPHEMQQAGFARIAKDWESRGYNMVVVGSDVRRVGSRLEGSGLDLKNLPFQITQPAELFK